MLPPAELSQVKLDVGGLFAVTETFWLVVARCPWLSVTVRVIG